MIPSCLPQKSQFVQAAINTSSIALFSKCLIATGTASAWSAATARHNWRTSASPGVTVSTAKTISSSEQLSENKPVLNKTLIINYFFSISIYGLLDEMYTDGNLLFPKGDSGPNAQHVSRGFRPHRWWGGRRTSSTTCTALPALYASGNLRQVTSTIWWRTAGWSARPTTRPPSREVSCRYVTDRETVGKSVGQTPGSGMLYFVCLLVLSNLPWQTSSLNFDPPALIASLPPNRSILNCIKRRSGGLHLHSALERISFQ